MPYFFKKLVITGAGSFALFAAIFYFIYHSAEGIQIGTKSVSAAQKQYAEKAVAQVNGGAVQVINKTIADENKKAAKARNRALAIGSARQKQVASKKAPTSKAPTFSPSALSSIPAVSTQPAQVAPFITPPVAVWPANPKTRVS